MTVTKYDLAQDLINNSDLTRIQASKFVDDFFEIIIKELADGEEIKIAGFGNFILRDKKERFGRNPKTREEFPIAARRVVSFHTSNILKVNIKKIQSVVMKNESIIEDNISKENYAQGKKKILDKLIIDESVLMNLPKVKSKKNVVKEGVVEIKKSNSPKPAKINMTKSVSRALKDESSTE